MSCPPWADQELVQKNHVSMMLLALSVEAT